MLKGARKEHLTVWSRRANFTEEVARESKEGESKEGDVPGCPGDQVPGQVC